MIQDIEMIYDGDCPVCQLYVGKIVSEDTQVICTDARQNNKLVNDLKQRGYNLDKGIVLNTGDEIYFGWRAIHEMAKRSRPRTLTQRLNRLFFSNAFLARISYPFMRTGRNLLLRFLGKGRLNG